jgi:hypothetical protein
MALLQISEPGESPAPHQRRLAVGIDLGTTHSLVAAVRSSVPEVLSDKGRPLVPSAVYMEEGGHALVGSEALAKAAKSGKKVCPKTVPHRTHLFFDSVNVGGPKKKILECTEEFAKITFPI